MNLETSYLGLALRSPFVVGASPFCDDVYVARKLQDTGAAAVVMRSLFEEQLELLPHPTPSGDGSTVADYPEFADYQLVPEAYLRQVERLKKTLTIPVIASLNGCHPGTWIEFARRLESAGADALELNFYHVVTDPSIAADQVETEMLETVGILAGSLNIPVAVKLSPYHASVAQLAVALELAGAAGVTVFNRFYQPEINIDDIKVQPQLHLSESHELLLRLRWLAILAPLLRGSLAATGGVHTSADVVKALLTGAHAVQVVSVLLKHGPFVLATMRQGLEKWMGEHGYTEIDQFRGLLNLERCRDPENYERANYIRVLQSWKV
jgi:dihydroorotate dehydrogenase (fumarate)